MPRWKNEAQTNDALQRLKREAILKEAGRAFSQRGYHNTSLDDVAATLQVSKGTLYNYVRDKQEILFECHLIAIEMGKRAFKDGQIEGTAAEILEATLRRYIELLTTEIGACGVLMEVDGLRAQDRAIVTRERDAFERNLVSILRAGFRDGSIKKTDPKIAVFAFMGTINWMPRWYSPDGRLTGPEIARQLTELMLHGLLQ